MSQRGIAWLQLLVALAAIGAYTWLIFTMGERNERVGWQQQELKRSQESRERSAAALGDRDAASRYALRIGENLGATQAALDEQHRRTQDALRTATAGRACLSARAVELLNAGGRPNRLPAMPESPSGQPTAPDSTRVATDTDVAGWINDAKREYNLCRETVICWNAWYDGAADRCEFEPKGTTE